MRALKESGVIRIIRAQVDPALAGFPLQVWVTATLFRHDPRSSAVFEDHVRSLPQVIAADNLAGETDYLLSVVARDVAELQQVLASLSGRGGQRLVTYLRLAEVKPPSPLPLGRRPRPPHLTVSRNRNCGESAAETEADEIISFFLRVTRQAVRWAPMAKREPVLAVRCSVGLVAAYGIGVAGMPSRAAVAYAKLAADS